MAQPQVNQPLDLSHACEAAFSVDMLESRLVLVLSALLFLGLLFFVGCFLGSRLQTLPPSPNFLPLPLFLFIALMQFAHSVLTSRVRPATDDKQDRASRALLGSSAMPLQSPTTAPDATRARMQFEMLQPSISFFGGAPFGSRASLS